MATMITDPVLQRIANDLKTIEMCRANAEALNLEPGIRWWVRSQLHACERSLGEAYDTLTEIVYKYGTDEADQFAGELWGTLDDVD